MESNDPKKSFELIPSETNPETGTVTFDVKYNADFPGIYKAFKKLNEEYKKFLLFDEVKKDPKFKEIYKGFNYLFNQYKSHMRENYPKQYSLLKAANEEMLKELVQNHLKEMSLKPRTDVGACQSSRWAAILIGWTGSGFVCWQPKY